MKNHVYKHNFTLSGYDIEAFVVNGNSLSIRFQIFINGQFEGFIAANELKIDPFSRKYLTEDLAKEIWNYLIALYE